MPDKTQGGRESFRLLYPPHTRTRAASLPDSSFFHTLQIDQMVSVRRESWRGLPDLRLVPAWIHKIIMSFYGE